MSTGKDKQLQERIQRIATLTREIDERGAPDVRASVTELLECVMELHGAAFERLMELVSRSGDAGDRIVDSFVRDELVSSLLLLYGLHPQDLETRVQAAVEKVRPSLRSHGGEVELLGISEGVVRLRLEKKGNHGSSANLKSTLEQAIYEAAPDVLEVICEGVADEPPGGGGFVPLEMLLTKTAPPSA